MDKKLTGIFRYRTNESGRIILQVQEEQIGIKRRWWRDATLQDISIFEVEDKTVEALKPQFEVDTDGRLYRSRR